MLQPRKGKKLNTEGKEKLYLFWLAYPTKRKSCLVEALPFLLLDITITGNVSPDTFQ